jgi:two-component system NtrC family sensor kinase
LKKPEIPSNEEARLRQLIAYDVLDTESELAFDDITKLASIICGVPIAVVSLVDRDRQWFKSHHGLDAIETPRDISFCGHAIHDKSVLKVVDAALDPRFFDNPLVADGPKIRFYAGAPLVTPAGLAIGTLCVLDDKPGDLTAEQTEALESLARQVIHLFELRIKSREIRGQYNEMKKYASLVAEQKQQLFYSAKMASMGQMASGLAHEINNPLAILLGRLGRLLESTKKGSLQPEQAEKSLTTMIQTGERIAGIVRGLRTFARDGASDPAEEMQLNKIIHETCEILIHRCKAEKVHLKIDCDEGLVASGVPVQVSQILVNLVSNSFDAIRELPDRWIHIQARRENGCAIICVTDSGKGLDIELQEKVMQPFFTTKPAGQGTGLGLSISKRLAENMGGRLRFDVSNKNTSFELTLPKVQTKIKSA